MTYLEFIDEGPNHTLKVKANKRKYLKRWDGGILLAQYGLFYNSWDRQRHIAIFVPYAINAHETLCGKMPMNFSATRERHKLCPSCAKLFNRLNSKE